MKQLNIRLPGPLSMNISDQVAARNTENGNLKSGDLNVCVVSFISVATLTHTGYVPG